MMQIRDLIAGQAKEQGFKELRISGFRTSGANSGEIRDVIINLTKPKS